MRAGAKGGADRRGVLQAVGFGVPGWSGRGWEPLAPRAVAEIATPGLRARLGGALMITAAVLEAVAAGLSPPPGLDRGALSRVVGAGLLLGVGLLAVGRHLPGWMSHLIPAVSTVLLCAAILTSGGGGLALAFAALTVFVVTDAFVAFPWWQASAHTVVTITAGAVCLTALGPVLAGPTVLGGGVTVGVALTVGILTRLAGAGEQDRLTGLLSQRGFDRALHAAISRAEGDGHPLCLAFLDVDHFARVNDVFGRAAGDRLLTGTANALRARLDTTVTLARWSGDRFVVLSPGWSPQTASSRLDPLRGRLPQGVTCSIGVAAWEPGDSASLLINRAEALLYQAKQGGRNRLVAQPRSRRATAELRAALTEGQLVAVYQPVVELGTGHLVGAEALVRWAHPRRGIIGPDDFLADARTSGLITDIDRWMLSTACAQAATWRQRAPFETISVNVSGQSLISPGYLDHVRAALQESGFPADSLVLEIVEDVLAVTDTDVTTAIHGLRELGVRLAIDDFGTGYSSLSRLDALPVDILKIDRSFVSALLPPLTQTPILTVITSLGHGLHLDLVAEGIETAHQWQCLASLGCQLGQGFLFGHAITAAEFTAFASASPASHLRGTADAAAERGR